MTQIEVRKIVREYINRKGVDNINGYDFTEIRTKYGANGTQIQNAINYFKYSKQAKAYTRK